MIRCTLLPNRIKLTSLIKCHQYFVPRYLEAFCDITHYYFEERLDISFATVIITANTCTICYVFRLLATAVHN